MASMIFASSPLSVQSFVKLRPNSNYSYSPCYVSRAKNSYIHLSFKNISNIQSSKSLFTKGDGSFSFSSTKFPTVASKYSPSLNIIKACTESENIYQYNAYDVKKRKTIQLGHEYEGKILLIVNLPQKISSEDEIGEMKFLNNLLKHYKDKTSGGFEVLGFFPYMEETKGDPKTEEKHGEEKNQEDAHFSIFRRGGPHDDNDCKFWNFLRKIKEKENQTKQEEKFEKYLVDWEGKCIGNFPWFESEQLEGSEDVIPGMYPGHDVPTPPGLENPAKPIQTAIDKLLQRKKEGDNTKQ